VAPQAPVRQRSTIAPHVTTVTAVAGLQAGLAFAERDDELIAGDRGRRAQARIEQRSMLGRIWSDQLAAQRRTQTIPTASWRVRRAMASRQPHAVQPLHFIRLGLCHGIPAFEKSSRNTHDHRCGESIGRYAQRNRAAVIQLLGGPDPHTCETGISGYRP